MPTITSVDAVPIAGGFFFDDKEAISTTAKRDGFSYTGEPTTPGFERIRQPAEGLSVMIELDNGAIGFGDCTAVQYSGFGGRDTLFDAQTHIDTVETTVSEALVGRTPSDFRENVRLLDEITNDNSTLHTAVRYGVSQALLDVASTANAKTKAEVLLSEYDIDLPTPRTVPVFSQSGEERRSNAEKMILKDVPVLPHGLFNSLEETGVDGERLIDYVGWLSDRIGELGADDYEPVIHVDIYGTVGEIFGAPYDRTAVTDYFARLERASSPYSLRVESPIEADSRDNQIRMLSELHDGLDDRSISVDLVADEWCNTYDDITSFVDAGAVDIVQIKAPDLGEITKTVEAVQYCDGTPVRAYLGGSCAETDLSARVAAHIAVATQPCQILARPGMGVDEGYSIVENEMRRTVRRMTNNRAIESNSVNPI